MENPIRMALIAALAVVGTLLYQSWQKEQPQTVATAVTAQHHQNQSPEIPALAVPNETTLDMPVLPASQSPAPTALPVVQNGGQVITLANDVLSLKIDTFGGDIIEAELQKYPNEKSEDKGSFKLLSQSKERFSIAQSGLIGEKGPDFFQKNSQAGSGKLRSIYHAIQPQYQLSETENNVSADLVWGTEEGLVITKRFNLKRNSYVVTVEYLIDNHSNQLYSGNFYGRLKRQATAEKSGGIFGVQTFTGAALYTPGKPYTKLSFDDIRKKPVQERHQGGWAAMVEQYFLSAWVPNPSDTYEYQSRDFGNEVYGIEFVSSPVQVAALSQGRVKADLYLGPQITETLGELSKGLELSVDYGILWPVCQPIFWVLKKIYNFVGNWGVAIILITVFIKLLFYRLSASSFRSMGAMRQLQPRIEALKQQHGDDKQRFGQALMELYRKEKVNPLGGCFPILIQIPVFISLYYVLLGSVELRHASFIAWIQDLSAPDPFYVLPLIMGASMFIQQRLSPAPPDPMQAKVMMFMPIVFTVMFLQFPSGLVLYWVVNNLLSIAQQWYITRRYTS